MGSFPEALSIVKTPQLRDVSFSSYLNPSEEVFLRKLVETSKIPNSTITIQKENVCIGKKKAYEGEIGVFSAEKYFNEETVDHQNMKNQQLHSRPSILKIQARTPSVHSQSSWNSQSALLQSGQKNSIHPKSAKRRQRKSLLSALSCNCSCGDTNSVDIGEEKREIFSKMNFREEVDLSRTNKSMTSPPIMEEMQMKKIEDLGIKLYKEDCFTFPIASSKPRNLETKLVFKEDEDDKNSRSMEVFGSPILEKRNESILFERKPDLFTLDDDYGSDTSSDLFEIESFSTSNNSNPHLFRQASNVSTCVTPTTCYAPSEASIEWSVVTASVADFSFVSDSVIAKSCFKSVKNATKITTSGKGKEVEKKRSGILSGCKSQKAVRVSEDAYRTNKNLVLSSSPRSSSGRVSR